MPARTHRPLTVVALMLALFMGALEGTVVSTAMPGVIGSLGGVKHYSWVFTAYLLASTVTVPVYGKLADIYGRRPIILGGIGLFLGGSVMSGLAHSMTELIVWRSIQGLGAGAMQPIALTIIGDIFALEERARMQGLFGAVWGVAGLVGPVVGGVITDHFSWRWIFFMNVPFGLIAAALLLGAYQESVDKHKVPIDAAGAVLLTVGVLALLAGARADRMALVMLPIAGLLLFAFVRVEQRVADPVLPPSLFASRVISVSSLAGALVGAGMFAMITYMPLYVRGVIHGSLTQAGTAITPMVIGWPIASAIGGRLIPRVGFRPLVRLGLGISAAAAVGIALLMSPEHGILVARIGTALFGVGLGLANTALLIAVQTSVPWKQRGVATASTMFFRTIGGTIAIGIGGAILTAALAQGSTIPSDAVNQVMDPLGKALPPGLGIRIAVALEGGLGPVFWVIAGFAVVAFLVSLVFPHVPLAARQAAPAEPAPAH
jgi:EmrB/QacA subfamily drug resistance transporter